VAVSLTLQPPCPHAAILERLYAALPPRVQSFPVVVAEEGEAAFKRRIATLSPPRPQATGVDDFIRVEGAWRSLIVLRQKRWASDGGSVLLHELGHACMARADGKPLGPVSLEDILTTWPAFWQAHKRSFPTDYARTSASEGWAEACVEVLSGKVWDGYARLPKVIAAEVRRELGI
jgi:hypothetical protein